MTYVATLALTQLHRALVPGVMRLLNDANIDLGLAGGERGGYLLAEGTPEHLATIEYSATRRFLRHLVTPTNAESKAIRPRQAGTRV